MPEVLERRRMNGGVPSEPLGELERIAERMRRIVDQTFGGYAFDFQPSLGWRPLVDLEETDVDYVVEAELPGVKREEIDVELIGNELAISGESKHPRRKGTLRKQMRRDGRFDYRVALPDRVESAEVEAKLRDGVLTVHIPKSERSERRRIEVTS